MQTLQQELDPSPQGLTSSDHPVLRGHAADQAAAYAEEVQALRQRVVVLEAALAEANAARVSQERAASEARRLASVNFAPPCRTGASDSEFSQPVTPAVVAVDRVDPKPQEAARSDQLVSNPGFAQAWTDDEATFEERIAEKAFFEVGTIDEQSRTWLLQDENAT